MKFKTIKPPYQLELLKTKGLTNDLFLVNKHFFLKQSKDILQPFLNFTNQINVIKLIKSKKFTLPINEVNINNNKLLTLMPYYHNLINLSEQIINKQILEQISSLVKQLHNIKFDNKSLIKTWKGLEQLNLYCNLTTSNPCLEKITSEVIKWIATYQPTTIVLSHNDLTLNNFVKKNNCWYLIDWDFACWNDELFDIASFASESLTSETEINTWFNCFNLNNEQIIIAKKWMNYQNLIWYYWACYLYEQTNLNIYKEISESKLTNLLK
ncbi:MULTISPECIES: phosphotransferase [unclassified Spiroplasma]|uniref:phosphotransferase n=1 Tax=unclassified Spiroplasma TaxID=2637901 RepID=UPI002079B9CE|nr:phosphotransferase [Spiroplasma endosymbiont of Lariophagus distinguendus]